MNIGSASCASCAEVSTQAQVSLQKSALNQQANIVDKLISSTEESAPRGDTGHQVNVVA